MTARLRLNEGNRRWWTLGGDVLRPVHDHARQHGRERRAAVHPARPRRRPVVARVDDQRLHADASPSCSSPAGASATSSAAGGCSCSASSIFAALQRGHRPRPHRRLARRRPRRAGRRRRAHDAGDAVDHHQRLPAARARQGDRHVGRRVRARAGHRPGASAASSPSTSAGAPSSSSTCRSPSAPSW